MLKKISDFALDFIKSHNLPKFKYQEQLTAKLDKIDTDFDQNIINEIVLWKVNRYANMPENTLSKINQIDKQSTKIDKTLTREIITELLDSNCKGFGLPMVSTILRFRNPNIYQIIDQRVYRLIYGEDLILKSTINPNEIDLQITLYLNYLDKLVNTCKEYNIPFADADRIFYLIDKKENKDLTLKNYGSKETITTNA